MEYPTTTESQSPPHQFYMQGSHLFGHLRKDESWDTPCMVGIDEAGRGPVLGPMVYGSCISPICRLDDLKTLGFADSKVLSEATRERLFTDIKQTPYISWVVDPIHSQQLSALMLRHNKVSLNEISHNSAISMIQLYLAKGYNVTEVYVDTVGPADSYQRKLKDTFPMIPKIVVASKADALYPIVSAASICAKVTRDHQLSEWVPRESKHGLEVDTANFGSGYPADPVTKLWLRQHIDNIFGYPNIVRFSWGTTTKLLYEFAVAVVWGDEEEPTPKRASSAAANTPPTPVMEFQKKLAKARHALLQPSEDNKLRRERQRSVYKQESRLHVTTTLPF